MCFILSSFTLHNVVKWQNQPACYVTHGNSPSSWLRIFLGEKQFSCGFNPGVHERTAGEGISFQMLFIEVCNGLRRPVMHFLCKSRGSVCTGLGSRSEEWCHPSCPSAEWATVTPQQAAEWLETDSGVLPTLFTIYYFSSLSLSPGKSLNSHSVYPEEYVGLELVSVVTWMIQSPLFVLSNETGRCSS